MGISIGHRRRGLSEFGDFVAKELKRQDMKLKDLAEQLSCEAPAVSRYMGGRQPPEKVVEEMIVALGLSGRKAERFRELSKKSYPQGEYARSPTKRHSMPMTHRRSVRQFGGFVLQSIQRQVMRFGWEAVACEHDDDFAYGLKLHLPGDAEQAFVLLNLLQPQYDEPERLLRLFRGQFANDPNAKQILYFEPFARCMEVLHTEQMELFKSAGADSLDEWLSAETKGKGRLVHGGNWVAVVAGYLKPTDAVKAYLKSQ